MAGEAQDFWKTGSYQQPVEAVIADAVERWMDDWAVSFMRHPRMSAIIDDLESTVSMEKPFSEHDVCEIVERSAEATLCLIDDPCASNRELQDLDLLHSAANADLFGMLEELLSGKLASRFGVDGGRAAKRAVGLIGPSFLCLSGVDLPGAVRDYMRGACRCYVSDFDLECMTCCRSAVENMLKAVISYDTCEKRLRPLNTRRCEYAFSDRLRVAKLEGLLSQELVQAAQRIWDRGNKVIHEAPRLTQKVDVTIHETARVIRTLATGHDPYGSPSWAIVSPEMLT